MIVIRFGNSPFSILNYPLIIADSSFAKFRKTERFVKAVAGMKLPE